MSEARIPRDSRIVVVGAGAAGLCTAWYLKREGFKHVQVLEKSPRLGGKCRSLTVDGQSFDLGANYITSAYTRVRELARHVDAGMYTEKAGHSVDVKNGAVQSLLKEILTHTSFLKLAWQSMRFLLLRLRLRKLLTPTRPGFAHVPRHPELKGSFEEWLKRNNLDGLHEIFEIPLTLMGYGKLDSIAAVYALSYMSPGTFINLGLFAANVPEWLRRWPKRFNQGYGRMFERLAAEVDVLTGVTIGRITRGEKIKVEYRLLEQELEGQQDFPETQTYDYLVLACPQLAEELSFMDPLSDTEQRLFGQVMINPFFVSTYHAQGTEKIAAVSFSLPKPEQGQPYVVTRQYPDNDFISIYTRGDREGEISRDDVKRNNQEFLAEIHAENPAVHSFTVDDWAYFPHVSVDAVDNGFYTELEDLQGKDRTFYCGGLLAFELVETIAEHAHYLVQTHFVGRQNRK
jgi:protoporphyrinogen oxidase